MADTTRVLVFLNGGACVPVSAADGSPLSVMDESTDIAINTAGVPAVTIASFSKSAVAYWTTDLVAQNNA